MNHIHNHISMNVMMTPNNREEFPHINDTANTSLIDNGGKVKKIINNKKK